MRDRWLRPAADPIPQLRQRRILAGPGPIAAFAVIRRHTASPGLDSGYPASTGWPLPMAQFPSRRPIPRPPLTPGFLLNLPSHFLRGARPRPRNAFELRRVLTPCREQPLDFGDSKLAGPFPLRDPLDGPVCPLAFPQSRSLCPSRIGGPDRHIHPTAAVPTDAQLRRERPQSPTDACRLAFSRPLSGLHADEGDADSSVSSELYVRPRVFPAFRMRLYWCSFER